MSENEKPKLKFSYVDAVKTKGATYQPVNIVAAPGAGKKVMRDLVRSEGKGVEVITRFIDPINHWQDLTGGYAATGSLADYRTELTFAIYHVEEMQRLKEKTKNRHFVYTNSLFSNLAHCVVRYYNMVNEGTVSDLELTRWHHTVVMNSLMLLDMYPADLPIIFLRGNDGEPFSVDVENALEVILRDMNFPHVELTSPEDVATMVNKIRNKEIDIAEVIAAGSVAAGTSEQNN